MSGPNLSHKIVRLFAAAKAVGSHVTNAFTVTFDRSSGFFAACSAMVDSASTTSCLSGAGKCCLKNRFC